MKIKIGPHDNPSSDIRKIELIKEIRYLTGFSLREAKDLVDSAVEGKTEFEVESSIDPTSLKSSLSKLGECGLKTEVDRERADAIFRLKNIVKEGINICADIEEPDILEVLSVAFKMICEK